MKENDFPPTIIKPLGINCLYSDMSEPQTSQALPSQTILSAPTPAEATGGRGSVYR